MTSKEEWWERAIRKLKEQEAAEAEKRELRFQNADMLYIALRHIDRLHQATLVPGQTEWADAWDGLVNFLTFAKRAGLLD